MPLFEAVQHVDATADAIDFRIAIPGLDGKPLYEFRCVGGSDEFLDTLSGADEDYVYGGGDMLCTLGDHGAPGPGGLLGEDGSALWYSRGRYLWKDLIGTCGAYPEWGRHRTFLVSEMQLTLKAENIVVNGGKLLAFDLLVRIRPDKRATKDYTLRPGYLPPGKDCRKIRRGNAVRICRDWEGLGGSWTKCAKLGR